MKTTILKIIIVTFTLIFSACSSDNKNINSLKGSFVDSPVKGLYYETNTYSGYTNIDGQFSYRPNEAITFYLGNLSLGSVKGKNLISVIDFNNDSYFNLDNLSIKSLQTLQLLQTLDSDDNPDNGIDLVSSINDINLSNIDLNNLSDIENIVDTLNSQYDSNKTLVSLVDAKAHFEETLRKTIVLYESYDNYIDLKISVVGNNATGTLYDGENLYTVYGPVSNDEQFVLETDTLDGYYFKVKLQQDTTGYFVGTYIKYDEYGYEYDYYYSEYNGLDYEDSVGYSIYLYKTK